jgi:type IV secretion system protein VirB4
VPRLRIVPRVEPRRELELAAHLPYAAHVTQDAIATHDGDLVFGFRLRGLPFETRDDAELNEWHERLNGLWRNVAHPQLAVWSHVIRERVEPVSLTTGEGYAARLVTKYHEALGRRVLRANTLYLTFVWRAHALAVESAAAGWLKWRNKEPAIPLLADTLDAVDAIARQVQATLARYEPRRLGVVERGGRPHSTLLELLGWLVNGERSAWPPPRAPLAEVLPTVRPLFGVEAVERRGVAHTQLGAALALKEYPAQTTPGVLNRLLSADCSFVLTQSFSCLPKSTAQGLIQRQLARLANAKDAAVSQAEQLTDALDRLASNEFTFGDHHLTLFVWSEPFSGPATAAHVEALESQLANAKAWLADSGAVVAREDVGLEAAYFAQLPGNAKYRARQAPISSRNFAALVPLHDYAAGRRDGNHWGEAVALLTTRAASPYWFSLHASDPSAPDGGSRRDTGHTLICGPTGSGKTVFLGFCLARLHATGTTQVVFDKDRGLEPLVRALGGEYRTLASGQPTGLNPLQLPDAPEHHAFLRGWLRLLVARGLTAREDAELEHALRGTLALDRSQRRLSRLLEFLDPTDPEGVRARLVPWCAAVHGERAWAFDHDSDLVAPLLDAGSGLPLVGFDVTAFLDHAQVRGPVTAYLFHLVRGILDGRKVVVWMDEFARLLADPAFEAFAKDGLKTWRKLNAVAAFATQSAADILNSPIARTLVEQTPTKVLFPNPDLDPDEYVQAFGLGAREVEWVKRGISPGSRQFLVKQGRESVVAALDLSGMEEEVRVLSGRVG